MSPAYFQKAKRKKKEPKRYSSIPSKSGKEKQLAAKKLREGNPERRARRAAAFKARLSRADWKKLRLECFTRDGFRCTAMVPYEAFRSAFVDGIDHMNPPTLMRCSGGTWHESAGTDRSTGKGLVADHLTYARFGHENLSDLRTLCRSCNARLTRSERANHANGFTKVGSRGKA